LAVVIIGGLISATLLTLIVLPTLYLVIENWGRGEKQPAS
jgi:heavy metal efflux system protein